MTTINQPQATISTDEYRRDMLRHAARTAGATRFIAWVIAIGVVLSFVFGLIVAVNVAHTASVLNSPAATCLSLGGTDTSC